MKIKFLGAAGTVTGSKNLLSVKDKRYLVDCGLFQGLKKLRERNWAAFDFSPDEISAIFLTHAHIDHSGFIPRLINMGFNGPIFCSQATYELAKILLPDSGYLHEEEARFANKRGYSRHRPALPLYTRDQAEESLKYFRPVDLHREIAVDDSARITLNRAGHILGASTILVEAAGRRIAFSGDVGRYNDLIMRPPEPLPDADYLVIESTYGDRDHIEEDLFSRFAHLINEAVKKGGVIVVPAFAVGRAQHILYLVHELKRRKKIPDIDTYLDSPMAINATALYTQYHDEHKLSKEECRDMCGTAKITRTPDESRAINKAVGAKIIISASGMSSGGRILHHLAHYIHDEKNTVLMVGFQAAGTRGRALLDGSEIIKIFGEEFRVKAKIENLSSLSAHADSDELLHWLKESKIINPKVFVTHGEEQAAESLAKKIKDAFGWNVVIPADRSEHDL